MDDPNQSIDLLTVKIADVAILDLVREYGSPLYVYDANCIAARCAELAVFDTIRYAQKANSNLAILRLMHQLGICLDAVSYGEMIRATRAGYGVGDSIPRVVYTADVMTPAALHYIVEHRIPVNCGSLDMIRQLGSRNTHDQITIRVNPGFGHGHHPKANTGGINSKHGIWHEQVPQAIETARQGNLRITGVHMHLGSGADVQSLSSACEAMERMVHIAGSSVKMISAGGGIGVPYRTTEPRPDIENYFQCWDATRRRLAETMGHAIRLEVEPGRYLVAESGYLIAEVRSVQLVAGRRFYLLDAGFNVLARPVLYGAFHPITACPRSPRVGPATDAVVGGPLCESGDIFTQREGGFVETVRLPELAVGDLIVIGVAGAYGMSMASNYNSYPRPAEILIENTAPRLIRRRETVDDMLQCEVDIEPPRP